MDDDKILEITGKIENTLGKENFALISDSIGEILTGNSENMKQIAERDSKISMLEEKNEKLVLANGSLLQKIPVGQIKRSDEVKEEPPKEIKWDDIFDKKGGFIH